jgi:hypothetical protein
MSRFALDTLAGLYGINRSPGETDDELAARLSYWLRLLDLHGASVEPTEAPMGQGVSGDRQDTGETKGVTNPCSEAYWRFLADWLHTDL